MTEKDRIHIRKRNRKTWKYAFLSLVLLVTMSILTACALPFMGSGSLRGDNRKAYERLVKTSSYFRYPATVRIESGEMYDGDLYCTIRAMNSYGYYVSDSYRVSSDGYPSDSYSYRCSVNKLDYDKINDALYDYFHSSSSNSKYSTNGGIEMSETEGIIIYCVVLIVVICLNGLLASKASYIAAEKGYNKRTWFHMCFWIVPFSYVVVAAMPDKEMRNKQDETNSLLRQLLKAQNIGGAQQGNEAGNDVGEYLPEI